MTKTKILEAVYLARGNLLYAAHLLGCNRSTLYKQIRAQYLWPTVNKIRLEALRATREAPLTSLIGRARLQLRGPGSS